MKYNCTLGKIREICFISDNYISDRLKKDNLPILRNHIPLFYILPENGDHVLFNELAGEWNISKSSLSDIINKYQAMGLISKCECCEDKRSVYIGMTEEAAIVKAKLVQIENDLLNLLLESFDAEERDLFEKSIEKVLRNGNRLK